MRKIILACFVLLANVALSQSPVVPSKMEVAGVKLRIHEGARKEIQADVNSLTKYPKYFNIKVERANTYFPIIERIFKEENVPDDIKYLVLQESALISDAVSSSNAVGFWQFKDFTAEEVGMRVDNQVDERMNITSSSRGAAKYFKKNNFYFNNWIVALQAYQMGAGGAMRAVGEKYNGARSMEITKKTYWYVKKYLAHKIAFQDAVGKRKPELEIAEYTKGGNMSFTEIAKETGIEESKLREYNKWLKRGKVPLDKSYAVILPGRSPDVVSEKPLPDVVASKKKPATPEYDEKENEKYPVITNNSKSSQLVRANGLPGIKAQSGDNLTALARKGDLSLSAFIKYNDLDVTDKTVVGQIYYLKKKKNKAGVYYHTVKDGETYWSIAQKYGIRLRKLLLKNREKKPKKLKVGRVLWVRHVRPASVPIAFKKVEEKATPVAKKEIEKPKKEEKNSNKKSLPERKDNVKPVNGDDKKTIPAEEKVSKDKKQKEISGTVQNKETIKQDSISVSDSLAVNLPTTNEPEKEEKSDAPVFESKIEEKEAETEAGAGSVAKGVDGSGEVELEQVIHEVQKGQTFYGLSKIYGVTVKNILQWNGLTVQDKLSIGQKLIILTVKASKSKAQNNTATVGSEEKRLALTSEGKNSVYHEVKPGETMYSIARSYGVTIKELMEWNSKKDFNISLGEKLKIKKTVGNTN